MLTPGNTFLSLTLPSVVDAFLGTHFLALSCTHSHTCLTYTHQTEAHCLSEQQTSATFFYCFHFSEIASDSGSSASLATLPSEAAAQLILAAAAVFTVTLLLATLPAHLTLFCLSCLPAGVYFLPPLGPAGNTNSNHSLWSVDVCARGACTSSGAAQVLSTGCFVILLTDPRLLFLLIVSCHCSANVMHLCPLVRVVSTKSYRTNHLLSYPSHTDICDDSPVILNRPSSFPLNVVHLPQVLLLFICDTVTMNGPQHRTLLQQYINSVSTQHFLLPSSSCALLLPPHVLQLCILPKPCLTVKVYSSPSPVYRPSSALRPHSSLTDLNFTGHSSAPFLVRPRLLHSEQDLSARLKHVSTKRSKSFSMFYRYLGNRSMDQQFPYYAEISEWLKFQPLSILQLEQCERVILFIAGKFILSITFSLSFHLSSEYLKYKLNGKNLERVI